MSQPVVRVELTQTNFRPGDELAGAFVIPGGLPTNTKSLELSVLWHTSGKGTEDMGVSFYQGWKSEDDTLADLPNPSTFTVSLPQTPWTYDGTLIKIHWLVRVRLRYGGEYEVVVEAPFTLSPAGAT